MAQIGEWRGTEAASSKCCTDSTEGPAEVPFGKDLRMWRMSKEGLSVSGSEEDTGDRGTGQEGCLSCNKCNVVSVIGAVPLDKKIRQAMPSNPAWPMQGNSRGGSSFGVVRCEVTLCRAEVIGPVFLPLPRG